MSTPKSGDEMVGREVPLRKRPLPDRIEYFGNKLGDLLSMELPRDAFVAVGAAVVNLGAIATEVRALLDERDAATARAETAEAALETLRGQLGEPETEWGYGNDPKRVTPSGGRGWANDAARRNFVKVWERLVGKWRVAEEGGEAT